MMGRGIDLTVLRVLYFHQFFLSVTFNNGIKLKRGPSEIIDVCNPIVACIFDTFVRTAVPFWRQTTWN